MSGFLVFMICAINFLLMSIFSGCLLYFHEKKYVRMKNEVARTMHAEENRLEMLSNDLLHIAEVLYDRLEKKEKDLRVLMLEGDEAIKQVTARKTTAPQKHIESVVIKVKNDPQEYLGADAKYKEVYYYADKKMSLVEIAKKTGKPKGEIELILSLRKNKMRAGV